MLVENGQFEPTNLHLAPPERVTPDGVPLRYLAREKKTGIPGLSYGIVCMILRLAPLVQCRLVTDRQTDGRTDRHMTTDYTALA